ncbi:MAG: tRNA 2-thiocytidine biosynthesis protein TtcA [Ruminococcus sp.]|nr:tRNA 2-thiocytidine biosynthesis protein TtcA [Ruminococcus sp.]
MEKLTGIIRAAVERYNMIEDGDRIAVGVSGGKDSLVLLCGLASLAKFYPKKFTVVALSVDPCFFGQDSDFSQIEELCQELGVEYIVKRTQLYRVVFEERQEKNPCSLCAKMRRGILHNMAKEAGCNKLALGHHSDDAAQTLLMNLFCSGMVESFRPVTYLSRKDLHVIRPMIFCDESKVSSAAERLALPVVKSACPMDKNTQREEVGSLLKELSARYPDLKTKLLGALQRGNISGW